MPGRGLELKTTSTLQSKTYENLDTPVGTECGTVKGGSTTLPPEMVELAKLLASLSPGDRENLLQLAQALSTGPKDQVKPDFPDRVEI
jgi:hypothetical protein